MKEWLRISCLLCVFGFLREIRPSEPYVTEYIIGWRNVTKDQVNRDVYPIGTYSYLAQLIIVFLITDYLRYKPLIVLSGLMGIVVWCMLLWTTTLTSLQMVQIFYGTYMAAEVAYYTYIYAKVDKKYYARVTSQTRAAMFLGKLVAATSAQILIYSELMNYKQLNYITLVAQSIATIWAIGLPKVDKSLYFHRKESVREQPKSTTNALSQNFTETNFYQSQESTNAQCNKTPFNLLWQHFRNAYTNIYVIQWSIWYAVGLSGYLQVICYVQVVWNSIEPHPSIAWNGAVDAVLTTLAAVCALLAGYLHTGRLKHRTSLLLLSILSLLEGGSVLLCGCTSSIYLSYIGYVLFGAFYAFTITVASAEVARNLEEESFGLVFGINTMLALAIQSIMTIIVVTENGLQLNITQQYTVYAFYFIIVGAVYFIFVSVDCIFNGEKANNPVE